MILTWLSGQNSTIFPSTSPLSIISLIGVPTSGLIPLISIGTAFEGAEEDAEDDEDDNEFDFPRVDDLAGGRSKAI
jgi:hypothetical protein